MLYRFGHFIFWVYFKLFYRWRVEGREHIPREGPFIVCANHIKWIDPLLVGCSFPPHLKVHFMAKQELFRHPAAACILKKVGAFPVNRKSADYAAIRRSFQILGEGKVLGLFPEGTRSKTGKLQKAQRGAALIAGRDGVPVVPVAVVGPYRIGHPLRVIIGKPFFLPRLEYRRREEKKEKLDRMSELIMQKIGELFPGGAGGD